MADSTNIKPYTSRAGSLHYTSDATEETAVLIPTRSNHVYQVTARVVATETADFDEMASYVRIGAFKNDGGTLTLIGSVTAVHTAENTAGWDVTLDANSTNIRVRVTGAAATTIAWQVDVDVLEGGWTSFLNTNPDPDAVNYGAFNG